MTAARLAFEPSGALLVVWARGGAVEAASRPSGSALWSAPRELAAPEENATLTRLVSSSTGHAAAWWRPGLQTPLLAVRAPGGTFDAPFELPNSGGQPSGFDVGPAGELLALRVEHDPGDTPRRIEAATRPPGGPFGAFAPISPAEGVSGVNSPDLAIDAAGDAVAAWTQVDAPAWTQVDAPPRPEDSGSARLVVSERPAGGDWGRPARVSSPGVPTGSRGVAVNAEGAALVVGVRGRARQEALQAAVRPAPGRPFGPLERVTPFMAPISDTIGRGVDEEGVAALAYRESDAGRVRSVLRAREAPEEVRLTAAQLLINQRISQAAVRRANAIEARLSDGLSAADIRPGGLRASAFAPGVAVAGEESGAFTPIGPGHPLEVPEPDRDDPGAVRLTAAQLLINQRISQAAIRRANRLTELLAGGLTGAHVADGAITAEHLAPGLSIAGATAGGAPAPPEPAPTGGAGQGGRVTLSAAQLQINQRISQAAVRRLNSLRAQLERGLPGSSFAPGSITAVDLAPELRG